MASDGVFDNMYDNDIEDCIRPFMKGVRFQNHTGAANCIKNKSVELGNLDPYFSPFAKASK